MTLPVKTQGKGEFRGPETTFEVPAGQLVRARVRVFRCNECGEMRHGIWLTVRAGHRYTHIEVPAAPPDGSEATHEFTTVKVRQFFFTKRPCTCSDHPDLTSRGVWLNNTYLRTGAPVEDGCTITSVTAGPGNPAPDYKTVFLVGGPLDGQKVVIRTNLVRYEKARDEMSWHLYERSGACEEGERFVYKGVGRGHPSRPDTYCEGK